MINFDAQLPNTNGYTFLKDGTILSPDDLQRKIASGQIEEHDIDPNQNNLSRSLSMGVRGLQATGAGLGALAGGALGIDSLKNAGIQQFQKENNINQLYARPTDELSGIHSVGDAGAFVTNAIGQQLPGLAVGLLAGGVGGLVAKKAATAAIGDTVDNLVAQQVGQQAVSDAATTGFKAGMGAFGGLQSAGSIYPQAVQNNAPNPVANALVGGVIGGGLNFLGDNAVINNFKEPIGGSSFYSRLFKNVATDAAAQGSAGGLGTVNDRYFSNQDTTSPDAINSYINSFAQGAIGGAPFGALSAIKGGKNVNENANIDNTINNPEVASATDATNQAIAQTDNTNISQVDQNSVIPNSDNTISQLGGEQNIPNVSQPQDNLQNSKVSDISDELKLLDEDPFRENVNIEPNTSIDNNTNQINPDFTKLDLNTSPNFQRLSKINPELNNIKSFNADDLSDAGLKAQNINDIKDDLKMSALNSQDLGGVTLNDLLTKDTSNFTPEEIQKFKDNASNIINNFDDSLIANNRYSRITNDAIDRNYENSKLNPNPDNQIAKLSSVDNSNIQEANNLSQEKIAIQDSQPLDDNATPEQVINSQVDDQTLPKLTPEEQEQNFISGPDNTGLLKTNDASSEEIKNNISNAQENSDIVQPLDTNKALDNFNGKVKDNDKIDVQHQIDIGGVALKDFINKVNDNLDISNAYKLNHEMLDKAYRQDKSVENLKNVAKKIIDENNQVMFKENQSNGELNNSPRELTISEKVQSRKIDSLAKETLKNANVNVLTLHSKDSPFLYKNIEGFYDPQSNSIVVFSDKVQNQGQIISLLNHELLHAGVYQMTKGSDRLAYVKQMEDLAKNENLNQMANDLAKQFGYDRATSIEEALARLAETGEYRKLGGIQKFINYLKGLINKLLGGEHVTSDDEVQDYIARATDFVMSDDQANTINKNTTINSTDYVNDMANMHPDIMFSEKYTEKDAKDVNEAIKSAFKNIQSHEDLKNSTDTKNFFNKISDKVSNSIDTVRNKDNRYDAWNNIINPLKSMRELVQRSPENQTLQNIFDMGETQRGGLDQQIQQNAKVLQSKLRAVSDFDNKSVSSIMADFALQDNEGNGIRPSDQQIRDAIANYKDINKKQISNKQGAYELYQIRRANADTLVHKSNQASIMNQISFIERSLLSSENSNKDIIKQLKTAINNVNNAPKFSDAMKNIQANNDFHGNVNKLNDDFQDFYQKLNEISSQDVGDENIQNDFNNRMSAIKDFIENANKLVNENGFLPKDHSGKYTIQLAYRYLNEAGEQKKVVFGVHASDNFIRRNQYKQAFENAIEQLSQKGIIKDPNELEISAVDRQTATLTNMDPEQFINQAEREGISLTDEQIRSLQSVSEAYKMMDRTFKTGIGYSLDFDKTIFSQLRKQNRNIARNMFYNDEINVVKNLTGWKKDLAIEMQNAKQRVDNSDAITNKLRGATSLWYLGYNVSSASMQILQMMQAAPSWMGQYSGGTGIQVTTKSLGLAGKYFAKGTTGDSVLDQAIKDFTNPLLGAEQNEILFNLNKNNEFSRLNNLMGGIQEDHPILGSILSPYKLFSKTEEIARLTTFIASHDVFHNQDKYSSRLPIGDNFHEFAINNLIKVNGDYSSYNRPKAFQGPVAQTLFMFKQYLVFMGEMFKHMDAKAKGAFIGTLALSSGLNGMPFAQNIEDTIDFLLKMFHVPYSLKSSINEHLKTVGDSMGINHFETYAQNGIVPSVGVRAGVGDIVPFLGPILDIASGGDTSQAVQELAGPTSGVVVNFAKGLGKTADTASDLLSGNFALLPSDMTSAIKQLAPGAIRNVVKGGEQMATGYNINSSETAINSKADWFDATAQMFGYQTVSFLNQQQNQNIIQSAKDLKTSISNDFKNNYLTAKLKGNDDLAQQVIKDAQEFNRQAHEAKSGFAFNLSVSDWNKQARLNDNLDQNTRAIKGMDVQQRNSLSNSLGIDIKTSNNLTNI